MRRAARVVTVQQPLAGLDGELLLFGAHTGVEVDAVRNAMAVGDNQGRSGIGLSLDERLERVFVFVTHGDAGNVNVAIGHRDETKILLAHRLAAGGELRHRAARGGFRALAAGVGIHFGVEHENVHVPAAGQHVIQPAVTDVIRPAVAAEGPDTFANEIIGEDFESSSFA